MEDTDNNVKTGSKSKRITKLFLNYGINEVDCLIEAVEVERIKAFDDALQGRVGEKIKLIIGPEVDIYGGVWCLNSLNTRLL